MKDMIVDSNMNPEEALRENPDFSCPSEIRSAQDVLRVAYISPDGTLHEGRIVVHRDLREDVSALFVKMQKERFPIHSVIPLADQRFRWNDEISMELNNTSGFNYRPKTGSSTDFSAHASGRAIDINPLRNPYRKGTTILPAGASYDPKIPGTISHDSFIVRFLEARGWAWGGRWDSLKDYQHFEKL